MYLSSMLFSFAPSFSSSASAARSGCRVVGVEPVVEEALGHADRDVVPRLVDDLRVARHGLVERRRVALVEAGHRFEQQRRVFGRLREHAGLIEARRERDHAVARHAPVRGLDARDAGERGRLTNRAARVRARRGRRERAATAAAEPPDEPPGTSA